MRFLGSVLVHAVFAGALVCVCLGGLVWLYFPGLRVS